MISVIIMSSKLERVKQVRPSWENTEKCLWMLNALSTKTPRHSRRQAPLSLYLSRALSLTRARACAIFLLALYLSLSRALSL